MGNRLFVGNLPYEATDADLRKHVENKGYVVVDAAVIKDRETQRSRGFGFVTLDGDVTQAINDLDGMPMGGRDLRVNEAHERERRPRGGGGPDRFRDEPRQDPLPPPPDAFAEEGRGRRNGKPKKKDKKKGKGRRRQRHEEEFGADW